MDRWVKTKPVCPLDQQGWEVESDEEGEDEVMEDDGFVDVDSDEDLSD